VGEVEGPSGVLYFGRIYGFSISCQSGDKAEDMKRCAPLYIHQLKTAEPDMAEYSLQGYTARTPRALKLQRIV
jgi:hypothetical protein